jgi:hypothetical protein
MRLPPAAACLSAVLWLAPAQARAAGIAAGPQVSTLGAGAEISLPLGERFGLRIGGNVIDLSLGHAIDGVDYDTDVDFKSVGLVLDWYPGPDGFRLSAGMRLDGNRLRLSALPTQPVRLGSTTYGPAQVGRLDATVGFAQVAPYAGVGWQGTLVDGRLLVGVDVGVLYQGSPDVRLSAAGTAAGSAQFQADLESQRQGIANNLGPLRFFPVVALTLTYRF